MNKTSIKNLNRSGWISGDFFKYYLIVEPDELTCQKIAIEKQSFYDLYQQNSTFKLRPHVTVAQFMLKEMMEEITCHWIQKICLLQKSFPVTFNNFSGVPAHTIFLRIQDIDHLGQFTNRLYSLNSFFESNNCPPVCFKNLLHLPIATDLPEFIYNKAIVHYSKKCFHETFHVHKMKLLKITSEDGLISHVNTFTFPVN